MKKKVRVNFALGLYAPSKMFCFGIFKKKREKEERNGVALVF